MRMIVMKFGGSSVATPERINQVGDILEAKLKANEKFTVIFSAFGGVTDNLIELSQTASRGDKSYLDLLDVFVARHTEAAEKLISEEYLAHAMKLLSENHQVLANLLQGIFLIREVSPRTMDYLFSFGERNSNFIISMMLKSRGVNASYLDARKIIATNDNFGSAEVDFDLTNSNIRKHYLEATDIQITTGFIGASSEGLTTTLGRGGSDYTAAIIGAALEAEYIEIWTDVSGVLTADPRRVKEAFSIPSMTYAEAMEMSHFGAKVIYPPTLQPALRKKIPLKIKNTFEPQHEGTYISHDKDPNGSPVKGISSISKVNLITLQGSGLIGTKGIAAKLFNSLSLKEINIILITQGSSENSITFAIAPQDGQKAIDTIQEEFEYEIAQGKIKTPELELELSVIAIIGENMRFKPGIAGHLFSTLGDNNVNIRAIAQGSSELNISVVINKEHETKALNAIHQSFFLSDLKVINLYVVGTGLIGKALIHQIKEQRQYLIDNHNIEVRIVGIANSRKMHFDREGIDLNTWAKGLDSSALKMDIDNYITKMVEANLKHSIFTDNTASSIIANTYERILNNSISISTPNKIAASSSTKRYRELNQIAKDNGIQYGYETNVGAGLPILSSIQDLIKSGDDIIRIEAVLSGTLSFLFNNFSSDVSFSALVKEAKEKGFSEPDPREDLNGKDVIRKALILAREIGLSKEFEDVNLEPFLPETVFNAQDIPAFFDKLKSYDSEMNKKIEDAVNNNSKLRFICTIENGNINVALKAVEATHPFYNLQGSDNMIVIKSKRYLERTLTISGPGAGSEVTAAGVFAEIINIGTQLK